MATGLNDGRVVLWHVPTGQELGTITTRADDLEQLCFSNDDRALGGMTRNRATLETAVYIWSCRANVSKPGI
jgi:hypothetical protein